MEPSSPWPKLAALHRHAWRQLADALLGVLRLPLASFQTLVKGSAHSRDEQSLGDGETLEHGEATQAQSDSLLGDRPREDRIDEALLEQKLWLYRTLEPMLTQLPLAKRAQALGLPLEAAHVLALYSPIDAALQELGFRRIGEVGEEYPFDPTSHQSQDQSLEPGHPITIKQPGYRLGERILRRARVVVSGF